MNVQVSRDCLCGSPAGTPHKMICPHYPPYGYDANGVPFKTSQLRKAGEELGRKMAERVNESVLRALQAK